MCLFYYPIRERPWWVCDVVISRKTNESLRCIGENHILYTILIYKWQRKMLMRCIELMVQCQLNRDELSSAITSTRWVSDVHMSERSVVVVETQSDEFCALHCPSNHHRRTPCCVFTCNYICIVIFVILKKADKRGERNVRFVLLLGACFCVTLTQYFCRHILFLFKLKKSK